MLATLFLEMPYWWSARDSQRGILSTSQKHDWTEIVSVSKGKGDDFGVFHTWATSKLLAPVFSRSHPATVVISWFMSHAFRWLRGDWLLALRNRGQLRLVPPMADMLV